MKRKLVDKLIEWKDNNNRRKPILITGSRGVGKTYLAFDFGKSFYQDTIYINFERNIGLATLFREKDSESIIKNIEKYFQKSIDEETTILILDEIASCNDAINFLINNSDIRIPNTIAISSKPIEYVKHGEKLRLITEHYTLYPFDFEEYLWATGFEWYTDVIREHFVSNKKIPDIVHKELMDIFEQYLLVGGMPRAINEFINMETSINISEQHNSILESFYSDAGYHIDDSFSLKVKNIFSTMNMQIAKKNKKFQYKLIRKGATKNLYIDAIDYMDSSNMVIKVKKLDSEQFKLYLSDVGLQLSMINERMTTTAMENNFKVFLNESDEIEVRRGLIENYIAQNLIGNHNELFFWESNAQAKIDFIIKNAFNLLPIEVSIDDNTRSKSLSIFKSTYDINFSIKISTNNFGLKNNIKYVPLYAVFCIETNL